MRRKQHHLADDVFRNGAFFVSVTICTANRTRFLTEPKPAAIVCEEIEKLHNERSPVLGYCIMPDHVHMIVIHRCLSLTETVRIFKGRSSFRIRRDRPQIEVWQTGYFDHIIRQTEGIYRSLEYVFLNPVRQKLVEDWWDWPWTGSPVLGKVGPDMFAVSSAEDVLWQELGK